MMGDKLKAHICDQRIADIKITIFLFMIGFFLGALFT